MKYKNRGSIILIAIVFGFVFMAMLGGLFLFILIQHRQTTQRVAWEEAFQSAQAGINYYKWCLNNSVESSCSIEKEYLDPEGSLKGDFVLDVVSEASCGQMISKKIYSTGHSNSDSQVQRQLGVTYGRGSVAKYAYLLNSSVWAGADRQIMGEYHSNGGVRMDGENGSIVSSAQNEWNCTSSFGCSSCPISSGCRILSGNCLCPGVFTTTANSDPDLFNYPVPVFDFDGITVDLNQIKGFAEANLTYFKPSNLIDSMADGYHIIFKSNGTFDVWIITRLWQDYAYSEEEGWHYDNFRIRNEYFYGNYSIASACPVIFVEDNLWVEGIVSKKITIASANLISSTAETSVVLPNNITYTANDGVCGLAVIAEDNILISPSAPNSMELRGVYVAQKGRFGINHYSGNIKNILQIIGSVVSNGRVGTQWTSGSYIVSGFQERHTFIDPNLIYNAPPFVPNTEHDFRIIKWEEIE